MGSGDTHFSTAESGPGSAAFFTAAGGGSTAGGGAAGAGSEQSVSLAPAWAGPLFARGTAAAARAGGAGLPRQGSGEEKEGVEALREGSVVVRRAPAAAPGDDAASPLRLAIPGISPARQLHAAPAAAAAPAAGAPDLGAVAAAAQPWSFAAPQPATHLQQQQHQQRQPAASPQRRLWPASPASQPLQQPAAAAAQHPWQQQRQRQQQAEVPRYAAPAEALPPLAAQQPLPPGRHGWQRNPLKDPAGAPEPPPTAPSLSDGTDSWLASVATEPDTAATAAGAAGGAAGGVAAGGGAASGLPPPPLFRPPSAESCVMHRGGPGSRQHLLPAEEALYAEAEAGAAGLATGGAGGLGSARFGGSFGSQDAKSSPAKSEHASAFHLEAFAGSAAAADAAALSAPPGQRPSRTSALRQRHAAQLRQTDRDQYGVPVASSARPFSLWASPLKIAEASTGLGVYFVSLRQFALAALLMCLFAIYPLASNLTSQAWADSYSLVAGEAPPLSCHKGWDTSSWVTGSTAGSRCASASYSSSFDCPSTCTWTPEQLGGQCAGLAPPEVPVSRGPAAACLLHPPCSAAAAGNLSAPDGPCYCCDLRLDGEAVAAASAATGGTVPPAQLWVLFLGQLAFLLWVLLLTRAQLRAVHAADARVVTASDFTVLLSGVPTSLSAAELRGWCSHYGSVVAAFHVPDVGEALRVAQRLDELMARRAESDAWLASSSCSTSACCFNACALGATTRLRLQRALEDATRELRCYERHALQPTGAALVVFEFAEHAANCIEDHHRPALRKAADKLLCGATASAPRLASRRVRVSRAPEPSDFLWQHTACTGSAALARRLCSAGLTLLIVAAGAGVQYGLAVAGEQERQKRQSQLYAYNTAVDGALDFSSWAAFTASALEVTKLNAISILSGLAVVAVNWLVTLAVRKLTVLERWHTRTAAERWSLLKLSAAYLVNSFVVPLLAAFFAGSSSSWYSRGGLMESAFYLQLANAVLPPLAVLCDLEELLFYAVLSRAAKTQNMANRLLSPQPFLLAEQYASALTTLGLGVLWMPVLPPSPYLALLGLFLQYWADKIVALRRAAHPGNLRGRLVSSADLATRLLPLGQLLLMRFVFFVDEGAMVPVFWTGLAVWLAFAVAPLRLLLGLVPRRRSTVTGGLSYQETLGGGQRKGLDDSYQPEMPPCCSPAYRRQVAEAFALLPAPHPANEALLPRQHPGTGGAATRPPFRPDRSADRAVARAAASLRARQQAALSSSTAGPLGAASGGTGSAGASGGGGITAAAAAAAAPGKPPLAPAAAPPAGGPHHRRKPSLLEHTLNAVKDSIAGGASWMWNGRDPDNLFSYDWRTADAGDTDTTASAPPLPAQAATLPPHAGSRPGSGGGGGDRGPAMA